MAKSNMIVDVKELNKLAIELKGFEKQIPGAAASALNRTLEHVNTKIGRIVTQEYALKSTEVKGSIKKYKAKKGDLSASLISRGHTLSLSHFPFSPKKPGTKRPVKVKIKKSEGKKSVNTDPKAFVQVMHNSLNVFKRVGNGRKPVVVLRTLSVPQMIGNEIVDSQIQELAQAKLSERITHEVNYRLDKIQKKMKG
jgi:hypothetical protein